MHLNDKQHANKNKEGNIHDQLCTTIKYNFGFKITYDDVGSLRRSRFTYNFQAKLFLKGKQRKTSLEC